MATGQPPGIVKTRKEAALLLGITERTLCSWAREVSFPDDAVEMDSKGRKSNWNLPVIREWRDAFGRKGSDPEYESRCRQAQAQKLRAEARIKEAEAAERERLEQIALGNVLPRDQYEAALVEIITITRDRLLTLPGRLSKLPSVTDRQKYKAQAAKVIAKFLTSLANDVEPISAQRRD